MPRANLYIIEWTFPKHSGDWTIVPMTVACAAWAKRADADEVLADLRHDAFMSNVRYRVRRAMFLDPIDGAKPKPPGRAARKCVRRYVRRDGARTRTDPAGAVPEQRPRRSAIFAGVRAGAGGGRPMSTSRKPPTLPRYVSTYMAGCVHSYVDAMPGVTAVIPAFFCRNPLIKPPDGTALCGAMCGSLAKSGTHACRKRYDGPEAINTCH